MFQSRFQIPVCLLYGFASIPVPIVTCLHGNSCVILAGLMIWSSRKSSWPLPKDQIWAGHQRAHIKELKDFKSSVLTFMASVYARSCTLTYTFPLCRVEGTHVSDENVSCLVTSGLFSLLLSSWHNSLQLFNDHSFIFYYSKDGFSVFTLLLPLWSAKPGLSHPAQSAAAARLKIWPVPLNCESSKRKNNTQIWAGYSVYCLFLQLFPYQTTVNHVLGSATFDTIVWSYLQQWFSLSSSPSRDKLTNFFRQTSYFCPIPSLRSIKKLVTILRRFAIDSTVTEHMTDIIETFNSLIVHEIISSVVQHILVKLLAHAVFLMQGGRFLHNVLAFKAFINILKLIFWSMQNVIRDYISL